MKTTGGNEVTFTATVVANSSYHYKVVSAATGVETYCEGLPAAYNAASSTEIDTIVLLRDHSATAAVTIEKNVKLDLQTYTLTRTKATTVSAGYTLEILGTGTITSSSSISTITNDGTVNINGGATISSTYSTSNSAYDAFRNNSGATLNMSNGTIQAVYYALYNNGGTANITGGTVYATNTGTSYGIYNTGSTAVTTVGAVTTPTAGDPLIKGGKYVIYNSSGTVTVKKGTVETTRTSTSYGIYNTGSTAVANVGSEDTPFSATNPSITGYTYGVNKNGGTWNFYNGIVKGTNLAYLNEYSEIRATYLLKTGQDGNYKTAYLKLPEPPPQNNETSPWLPEGASWNESEYEAGVTMKDVNNNEWTWVVVPKSVTSSATTDAQIESALKTRASSLVTNRGSYDDVYYSDAQTGLTESEYNSKKSQMLRGIKQYGGFWIGKYETGFTETPTSSNYNTTTRTAVIKKDAYPYNFITCADSNTKAMSLAESAGGNGSLLFGTQWDLTLKYLVESGAITQSQATSNSTDIGNYKNKSLTIDSSNAKYLSSGNYTWSAKTGTKSSNTANLLTTGAAENTTNKLNIVDLAGNVFEWTMEYTSDADYPCTTRGGSYNNLGSNFPASYRYSSNTTISDLNGGFRPTMYAPNEPSTVKFTQGQLVTYGGETFHALYDVGSDATTMEIFAIYNLNSSGTAQVNTTSSLTSCKFSSSKYWSSDNQNLNNISGEGTAVTYCVPRIKKYALDKGAINGRLLTYEEALAIQNGTNTAAQDMLWGRQNTAQTTSERLSLFALLAWDIRRR